MASATATATKPRRGRPGLSVLPGVPARDRTTAQRNRRIKGAVTRKRNPLTQCEAAALYGVTQPEVSLIVRNPLSGTVKG